MLTIGRHVKTAAALAVAAGLGLAAAGQAGAQETFRIQSLWQAGSINQKVFQEFADDVAKASDGRLKIEPLPVKSVVAHNETIDAVAAGVLDGQHTGTVYFAGRDPAFGLLGDLNAGYEDPYQMTMWFYHRGGLELARELYRKNGLFFVGPVFWGVESIPMTKQVETVEEFEGVKLRMPEGPASDIFRRVGAAPTNIPGSEVYTSLERGVIDGTDWGTLSMNQDLGYHEIAQFPIYPGIHSMPVGDLAVNLAKWEALPDDLKAIFETSVRAFNLDMIQTMEAGDLEATAAARDDGATLVDWSAEERQKLRQVASEVWADYASKNDLSKRIYESHVSFLKELGLLD